MQARAEVLHKDLDAKQGPYMTLPPPAWSLPPLSLPRPDKQLGGRGTGTIVGPDLSQRGAWLLTRRLDSIFTDLVRGSVFTQLCDLAWQLKTIDVHVYKISLMSKSISPYIEARPMDKLDV